MSDNILKPIIYRIPWLIITIAGGNIITIFANLVHDLLTFAVSGGQTELSTFN